MNEESPAFRRASVNYLVLDDLRRVDILLVGWAGR